MSRIGKKTIVLPGKVEFNYNADTNLVEVKGPLGKLSLTLDKHVTIKQEGENVNLIVENETNKFFTDYRMIHNIYDLLMLSDYNPDVVFKKEFEEGRFRKENGRIKDPLFEYNDW